ncbi:DoxX family protein [Bdellovibrio sp. NC01]|uniref:DoxX family protein n=1 Tax=Bdellovibrio sp. NC01 TaxID=2220073 RepID=UPI0011579431|nr:DoxX family protein [Bdellovibrio sp. NC01]QDK38517.1 DoxX family protein [Bdellovibrio sp. NC01]
MTNNKHQPIAYAVLRFALGLNIFLHGLVRIGPNYSKFIDWTMGIFKNAPLPDFAVQGFAYAIPPLELLVGGFLLVGLFTLPALVLGSLVMIALMAGMCIVQNWEIVGIQMIYILLYAVLTFGFQYNTYSIDSVIRKK